MGSTSTYNAANQMVASGSYSYLYDGNNKRVKQTDGHGTSYSFYATNGKLMYRKEGGSHVDYYYLGQKLVAKKKGSTVTYLHTDYLGSIAAESNTSGTVTSRMHYRPFGEPIDSPAKDDVAYTGHKYDTDLSLSYMQARYYDPVVGRFYENDPAPYTGKNIGSFNRYAYVGNNPLLYVDPTGSERIKAGGEFKFVMGGGGKVAIEISGDTESFEIGISITGGLRAGEGIKASVSGGYEQSSKQGNAASIGVSAVAEANLGPATASVEAGVNTSTSSGPEYVYPDESLNGKVEAEITANGAKVAAGFGVDAGIDVRVNANISIPDTYSALKSTVDSAASAVYQGAKDLLQTSQVPSPNQ